MIRLDPLSVALLIILAGLLFIAVNPRRRALAVYNTNRNPFPLIVMAILLAGAMISLAILRH